MEWNEIRSTHNYQVLAFQINGKLFKLLTIKTFMLLFRMDHYDDFPVDTDDIYIKNKIKIKAHSKVLKLSIIGQKCN